MDVRARARVYCAWGLQGVLADKKGRVGIRFRLSCPVFRKQSHRVCCRAATDRGGHTHVAALTGMDTSYKYAANIGDAVTFCSSPLHAPVVSYVLG